MQRFLEKRLASQAEAEEAEAPPRRRGRSSLVTPDGVQYANRGLQAGVAMPTKASSFVRAADGELPEKVDLRSYCSPVEDQKQSNSCAANAVAGAYEYLNTRYILTSPRPRYALDMPCSRILHLTSEGCGALTPWRVVPPTQHAPDMLCRTETSPVTCHASSSIM